ncbi:MAG: prolyl-tRNA synthetase associated domain-containing protein [Alphaproteobacteria bacterium]
MHTPLFDKEKIYQDLNDKGIEYKVFEHPPVFTVEEAELYTKDIDGVHIKNLFVYDKKKNMWLITIPHDIRPDLKKVKAVLGTSGNLSFCNPDRLWENLGVKPGSVTPLSVVNDTNGNVTAVIDKSCTTEELVCPHPLLNDATVQMKGTDLIEYMKSYNHEPMIIDFKNEDLLQD